MDKTALLIEELADATGLSRRRLCEAIDAAAEAIADDTVALRTRVAGIMATPASLRARFDEVMAVTDDNLDRPARSRIAGALGFGLLGGLVLAGATTAIVELVGILLIVAAGFMIRDLLRIAMDRLKEKFEAFSW